MLTSAVAKELLTNVAVRGREHGSALAPKKHVRPVADHRAGDWGYCFPAKEIFRLTYPCAVCIKPMAIIVGEADATRAIEALFEDGWRHTDCVAT